MKLKLSLLKLLKKELGWKYEDVEYTNEEIEDIIEELLEKIDDLQEEIDDIKEDMEENYKYIGWKEKDYEEKGNNMWNMRKACIS